MCKQNLKELLILANSSRDHASLQCIIEKFQPIIRKYSRQLNYDGAESDLVIFLLELIFESKLCCMKFYSEGELVNFIVRSLHNKKVDIYRKHSLRFEEVHIASVPEAKYQFDFEDMVCLYDVLLTLSERQRTVIVKKYFYGYSDAEIAQRFQISRQAVNKIKLKAIRALYKNLAGCD